MKNATALKSVPAAIKSVPVSTGISTPRGTPGQLMELRVKDIQFDPLYQRGLKREHSSKIAREWDWALVKAVSIARRPDGSFWAYDGQHTVTAALIRGDIQCLPCYVVDMDRVSDEALSFLKMNLHRIKVNTLDQHRAAIAGGDEAATRIQRVFDEFGVTASATRPGVMITTGVSNIRNQFARLKNFDDAEQRLRDTLQVLLDAWGHEPKALTGTVVRSMWRLVSRVQNRDLLIAKAKTRLGRYPLEDLLVRASVESKARNAHMTVTLTNVMMDRFNFRASKNLLVAKTDTKE